MQKTIQILGSICGLACLGSSGQLAAQQQDQIVAVDLVERAGEIQAVPGEIIVKFRQGGAGRALLPANEALQFGLRAMTRTTSGGEVVYQFTPSAMIELESLQALEVRVEDVVQSLNQRADVEYAQPNWILRPHVDPNDTHYDKQWHYWNNGTAAGESPGGIGLPDAWETTTGDINVVVAVLDTGILPNHVDISGSGNVLAGYDMISDVFIANDGDARDADPSDPGDAVAANECFQGSQPEPDSWHGSHVAGTVGAVATGNGNGVAGVNWTVSILPVRVLGKCGGTTVDINDGIRWAAGLPVPGVPNNPSPARVINMSLGGPIPCANSPSTQQAIQDAANAGALVVVSAGNDAADAANSMPASCNGVVTVAASDARGHLASRYSNFGDTVEIMAPGGDIRRDDNTDGFPDGVLSTVAGSYSFYNGTSMAAPHVSGAAALLLAHNPGLTSADLLSAIQSTALARSSTECPQPCGSGLLQVTFDRGGNGDGDRYEYAAKFMCGVRGEVEAGEARYETIVNIRNPGQEEVEFTKRLELALPPGSQRPGETADIATERLPSRTTLAANCEDVARRLFGGSLPAPFIDGYLVISAPGRLDVSAAYITDVVRDQSVVGTDLEVERVWGRRTERASSTQE